MCGICGIVQAKGAPIDRVVVRSMREKLAHRGPDDAGEYFGKGVGLGFRRLAIIDLSPAGHQPMANEDETIWIVFNGEVYNFQELRKGLVERGHRFRSQTDSEVILHLYEEHGVDCLQHLRGMFAFALWDAKRERLFLARDRFGKKPLVYAQTGNHLAFASEIQGLLPAVQDSSFDMTALSLYLRFQFIPSPYTIYSSIRKLPPAHYLLWERGTVRVKPYWQLQVQPERVVSLAEAGEEFERLLRASVHLRLTSDVPLGAFLSGGLDSSIITALMAEELQEPVKTFSIGFEEQSHNELPLARQVAERYGTEHHEFVVKPDVAELLPRLLEHYGEPFADSSAIPTYYVARETRRHVTVALTGDGGDENLAGYEKYDLLQRFEDFDVLPGPVRRAGATVARSFNGKFPSLLGHKLRVGAELLAGDRVERYIDQFAVFPRHDLHTLLQTEALRQATESAESFAHERIADLPPDTPFTAALTALDLRLYLPEGLMAKADIATMANALEARSPFLDQSLVEFTARLPESLKMHGRVRKFLLRQRLGHLVPSNLLTAPKKGFDLPVNSWLRGGLAPFMRERLLDASFRSLPFFHMEKVSSLMENHLSGRAHYGNRLWALLCFAVWHEGQARQ